ncbi:MAG TPA: hypothetical protein VI076_10990 [Actinopolymorphaceae bacterium]
MAVGRIAARGLAPMARQFAPQAATGLFRTVLDAAVDGKGRFPGATTVARRHLRAAPELDGAGHEGSGLDIAGATHDVVEQHVRLAGAQGFVTSLGGFAVLPLALPANITGLAVLQSRMVAAIAWLRGYDLSDPRVRTAIMACLLGEECVTELVDTGKLPSSPAAIATAPVHDAALYNRVAVELGSILTTRVGGKRLGLSVSRRVPLLGGGVGAVVDAVSTYKVGRYAERELPLRGRPLPVE